MTPVMSLRRGTVGVRGVTAFRINTETMLRLTIGAMMIVIPVSPPGHGWHRRSIIVPSVVNVNNGVVVVIGVSFFRTTTVSMRSRRRTRRRRSGRRSPKRIQFLSPNFVITRIWVQKPTLIIIPDRRLRSLRSFRNGCEFLPFDRRRPERDRRRRREEVHYYLLGL